jgi:hypothetical protein
VAILSAVVIAGSRGEEEQAPESARGIGVAMRLAVAAAAVVILLAGASMWSLSSKKLLAQVAETYPVGAVHFIQRNHLQGPLLNELSWGGFLIYTVPEVPPSMDGRTNVHSQDEILRALPLWSGEVGWDKNPELARANLVISNHSWPLAHLLLSDARFRVVYQDHTAVLFQAVPQEKAESQAK